MAEDIGALYKTKIPDLADVADIKEAFRLYHYGASSTSYDPTNTSTSLLVADSIAGNLHSLQSQIDLISGNTGLSPTTWTTKGDLVTRTSSTVTRLGVGTDGTVLTADSSAATGIAWTVPSVTPVNTVTLTNKTLSAPRISSASFIGDSNGNELISFPSVVASAVNEITVSNAATGNKPTISATGGDTNITLNLISKGTGTVQANGIDLVTLSGTQTLTNKTLTAPTITQLYVSDSVVVFEGSTADAFETTLSVIDPTADRTINLPNVDGTVITTGNLSSITSTGTLTSLNVSGNVVSHIDINSQSNSYTLVISDDARIVEVSNASANTITIPLNSSVSFPIGTQIVIVQTGAGQTTISGAVGVTLNCTPQGTENTAKLRTQWSSATIVKRGTDSWMAIGDLVA